MKLIENGIYRTEDDELRIVIFEDNEEDNQILVMTGIPSIMDKNKKINSYVYLYHHNLKFKICDRKILENSSFLGTINESLCLFICQKYENKIMEIAEECNKSIFIS